MCRDEDVHFLLDPSSTNSFLFNWHNTGTLISILSVLGSVTVQAKNGTARGYYYQVFRPWSDRFGPWFRGADGALGARAFRV